MNLGLEGARLLCKLMPKEFLYEQLHKELTKYSAEQTEENEKRVHQAALMIVIKGFDGNRSMEEILKGSAEVRETVELHKQIKAERAEQ